MHQPSDAGKTTPMWAFHAKHLVCDHEDFRAVIEEYRKEPQATPADDAQQMLFLHLTFHRFSKSALARLLKEWRVLRSCVTAPLFAYAQDDDSKWERFVTLLGFKPLHFNLPFEDGTHRRLFVSFQGSENPPYA